jgi:glycosyltransferase involved in cell wall biosynthesis
MWRALDDLNPNIVIIHEYSPYVLLSGLLWAKAHGKTCVITTDVGPVQRSQLPLGQRLIHQVVNSAVDGVLAKTQDAYDQSRISQKCGLLAPHAIHTRFYQTPSRATLRSGPPRRIIQAGSLIHRKGFDLLLRAFARARQTRSDLELTLVGAGDHATARQMAIHLGVAEAVHILDFVQTAELARLYAEHDLFVLASRFDTYGVVVHEAAASGLPLVVSRYAGASATLVVNGVNGRQVDPEATEEFAEAILECLEPSHHARYSEASRQRAEMFDVRQVAMKTAEWLRQVASNRRSSALPRLLQGTRLGGLLQLMADCAAGLLRNYQELWLPDAFDTFQREILFLNRYIPFYREAIFRKVAAWKTVKLVFSGKTLGNLPSVESVESASVPFIEWGRGAARKIIWLHALPQLWLTRPRIVCTEHSLSLLSTWGLFVLRPILGFKLVFWTHGLQEYGWKCKRLMAKDRLRLWWLKWADAVVFYSRDRLQDVEEITGPQAAFFVAPNALDVTACDDLHERLLREGRMAVRERLQFSGTTAVFLGRLTADKEPLKLAEFMRHALEHGVERLEVIGGGELEPALRDACAFLGEKVRFHGPLFDPYRRHELLFASDFLISPGYVGLNVVDSLLAGCPVATLPNAALVKRHSPEITYLHPGFNAIIAPDIVQLAAASEAWLSTPSHQSDAHRQAIRDRFRQESSLESQFEGLKKAFEHVLNAPGIN